MTKKNEVVQVKNIAIKADYAKFVGGQDAQRKAIESIVAKACLRIRPLTKADRASVEVQQATISSLITSSLIGVDEEKAISTFIKKVQDYLRSSEYCPKGYLIVTKKAKDGHEAANKAKAEAKVKSKGAQDKGPKTEPKPKNEEALDLMFGELSYTKKVKAIKAETTKNNIKVLMSTLASSMLELGVKPNEFELVMLGLEKQKA